MDERVSFSEQFLTMRDQLLEMGAAEHAVFGEVCLEEGQIASHAIYRVLKDEGDDSILQVSITGHANATARVTRARIGRDGKLFIHDGRYTHDLPSDPEEIIAAVTVTDKDVQDPDKPPRPVMCMGNPSEYVAGIFLQDMIKRVQAFRPLAENQ